MRRYYDDIKKEIKNKNSPAIATVRIQGTDNLSAK